MIGGLACLESLQLRSGRWMSPETCREYQQGYLVFRASLNLLAQKALERGVQRYRLRPKLHQMGHLCVHFLPKNPRYLSCYQDEDFVFRAKALAVKCNPTFVSQQAMYRYCVYLSLLYSGKISR